MANQERTITQTLVGQMYDQAPIAFKDGMYAFAKNAVIESFDGQGFPILQNEQSNILGVSFPSGSTVVGYLNVIEQNRVLWFLSYPESGMSEIGETINSQSCREYAQNTNVTGCDNCSLNLLEGQPLETIKQTPCAVYRTIQRDNCLNFSTKFPIVGIQYRLTDCTLQVFFTDNNNPRRWLEFNYMNDDPTQGLVIKNTFYQVIGFENPPCDAPIYGPDLDCNALNVQPDITTPCIQFEGLVGGGSNLAGVYQFFITMSDIKGNKLTSFLSATDKIPIFTKFITTATNYITDRSIKLAIQNLDPTGAFKYYNLAVAKTIDNVTAFYLVGTFPVTQTSYVYTGNNKSEIVLTADDVLALYPYYKTAETVGQSNGLLFWAGVAEYSKPNWQRVANEIKIQWQTIAIPEAVYFNPKNVTDFQSYMRDEVYALAIQLVYNTGEESNAYHIPGRASIPSDLEIINNDDVIPMDNCSGGTPVQRWQVYNTGTIEGGDLAIYDGCTESCYQFGNMGYWESIETYPNIPLIWGELCGLPIRHHKFPDSTITHIHNRQNGTVDTSGSTFVQSNTVFPIGIKVDHDSVRLAIANAVSMGIITADDAARVVGYRILRGNRFGNKSVVAKGLLYDVNQYQRFGGSAPLDNAPVYFSNYPYNDLRANPFLTNNFNNYSENDTPSGPDLAFTFSNRYTFQSPDTKYNQPSLGTELKLETVEYGQAEGFYNICKEQAKQKLLSNTAYFFALTAGVVAALLRTNDKTVIPYTVKSDYKYSQVTNGQSPFPDVTGTFTSGTGSVSTTEGDGTFSEGVRKVEHNNPISPSDDNGDLTDNVFGTDGSVGTAKLQDINGDDVQPAEYTITTTQGTYSQYFNGYTETVLNDLLTGLGTVVSSLFTIIGQVENFVQVVLQEMNIVLNLINSFNSYRDWCIQYNSIGKYNNYTIVDNDAGVKRRLIVASDYLDGTNQTINEPADPITGLFDSIKYNNFNREDAVYLKYDGAALPNAGTSSGIQDQSRIKLSQFPFSCALNVPKYTPISSYYASIKNFVADQYGTVYNIQYLRTGSCFFDMMAQNSGCTGVYGGDTFISRFAFKIKVPYFLATTFHLPNGTDFDFSSVTNLAFPRNYYNNTNGLGSGFTSILDVLQLIDVFSPNTMFDAYGRPKSIRDCAGSPLFYQDGFIYLYHYGIPYFFAESDYDSDYRYGTNNLEGDFFPHNQDLVNWLQEINVPIIEPNTYNYNNTYSKQNEETSIVIDAPDFMPDRPCLVNHTNRLIYSDNDNFLVYPANNFYDAPLSNGKIISLEGIENQTMLIRSENQTSIFKTILRLPVDGQTTQVGNGSIFSNPPQDFGTTTLGYIGAQNRAILHTEYGHISVDAKRGQIFNIGTGGSGIDEISKNGLKNWFKENLPFRILRDFPNMPVEDADNNFIGLGLVMAFDKRYNRFVLTKRDYKSLNKLVLYDAVNKDFYIQSGMTRIPVTLGDPKYFKDCSWTQSYNFFTKSWVSSHSYKPNYYIDFIDYFTSGINGSNSSWWLHDMFNGSYQVFYGKLEPFIVEPLIKFDEELTMLSSVQFDSEVRRYDSESNYTIRRDLPGFNKAIVYNDLYNSGLLNLVKTNKNDFSIVGKYPKKNLWNWDIEVAIANYKWRFNQFKALNKPNTAIPFWLYAGNNLDKVLNANSFNYQIQDYNQPVIKGQWFKTRLINDMFSNYKILYKMQQNIQTKLYR